MLILQLMALQISQASMVTTMLDPAESANVQPLTGIAKKLAEYRTAAQLVGQGVQPSSACIYGKFLRNPSNWLAIIVTQRPPGGTTTYTDTAVRGSRLRAGQVGVALPRRVGNELYGSFLSGIQQNLQVAFNNLMELLPAGSWLDHVYDTPSRGNFLLTLRAAILERDSTVNLLGNDDDNHLASLDFYSANRYYEESLFFDELDGYAPTTPVGIEANDLDVFQSLTEPEEELEVELLAVTNPAKSVSALMNGRVHQVELTDQVTRIGEKKPATEAFVLASLARQKARTSQGTCILDSLQGGGENTTARCELVGLTLNLPTSEQAAAEAEMFSNNILRQK
uniref:Uncharacterized protein MLCB628.19c n=1 Tax=Mycobacterium leprae TaxID=1769 RepID=O33090_MYCLR|nr:hypothetical protein [Mycobacterium leprae]